MKQSLDSFALSAYRKIFACIGFILVIIISLILAGFLGDTKIEYIASVEQSSKVEGNFVLGIGNVRSVTYYYFYVQIRDDLYKLKKHSAFNLYILETNNRRPQYIQTPYFLADTLIVPKGTIIKKYML